MDKFMRAAIDEALKGLKEGDVSIGAVLVENGKMMEEYIAKNQTLWNLFLTELNPDLIVPSRR